MPATCAPDRKNSKLSCFTKESLIKMAESLNKRGGGKISIAKSRTKMQLWQDIRRKLNEKCKSDESCWVEQPFAVELRDPEISEEIFRPKMPDEWKDDPKTWLSNFDIEDVMKQYEKAYPDFIFLGAIPSDCPSGYTCELTNFNPNRSIKDGIKNVGIVYNLDPHNLPGSHWVSMFIKFDKKDVEISYYDSYAHPPPPLIRRFINTLKRQLKGYNVVVKCNAVRHQFGNSECGVYSMYYIIQRLEGKSMKQAVNKKIPDRTMNLMRKKLFRK